MVQVLYTIVIIIGIAAFILNVQGIIRLWRRNKAKLILFKTYRAKSYLLKDKDKIKAHKQFIKEYNALGGNYKIEVEDKLNNMFEEYNLKD